VKFFDELASLFRFISFMPLSSFSARFRMRIAVAISAILIIAAAGFAIWTHAAGSRKAGASPPAGENEKAAPGNVESRGIRPGSSEERLTHAQAVLETLLAQLRDGEEIRHYDLGDLNESPQGLALIIRGLRNSGLEGEEVNATVGYLLDLMSSPFPDQTLALIEELTVFKGAESVFLPRSRWVLGGIALNEPEKAAAWLIQHPDVLYLPGSSDVVEALVAGVGKKDRARAWQLMALLPLNDRTGAIRAIAQAAADDEGRAEIVAEWRRRIQSGDTGDVEAWRTGMLEGLGQGLTGSTTFRSFWRYSGQAGETIAWLGEQGFTKEELAVIAESYRPGGSASDLSHWADWLETAATPDGAPGKIAELMTYWSDQKDFRGPEAWMARQEDEAMKETAAGAYVEEAVKNRNFEAAEQVAMALPAGEIRERWLDEIAEKKAGAEEEGH